MSPLIRNRFLNARWKGSCLWTFLHLWTFSKLWHGLHTTLRFDELMNLVLTKGSQLWTFLWADFCVVLLCNRPTFMNRFWHLWTNCCELMLSNALWGPGQGCWSDLCCDRFLGLAQWSIVSPMPLKLLPSHWPGAVDTIISSENDKIKPTTACQLWQQNLRCLQTQTPIVRHSHMERRIHDWIDHDL